jgi:RNA polymerase sigma-70 factor (ECF subfamily)
MQQSPPTRASLLVRIRDGADAAAWREFVDVYAPLVYGFARKRGLQDADAADLMQDVLRSVAGAARRLEYDPRRGTFRAWLYKVTRNKLYNHLNARRRRERATGDSDDRELLAAQPAPDDDGAQWDREYERGLYEWAAKRARGEFQPATWEAFRLTAVENVSPKDAAARTGLSVGAVYVAKSRVLARLRELVREVHED